MSHPIWQRLENEPDEAWDTFKEYRDRNPRRSQFYGTLARQAGMMKVKEWYDLYNWKERILAYDRYLDEIAQDAREQSIRQIEKDAKVRQQEVADDMLHVAAIEVEKALKEVNEHDFRVLKPREILAYADAAAKLRAISRGEPTEIVQTSEIDWEALSDKEAELLLEALAKGRKKE